MCVPMSVYHHVILLQVLMDGEQAPLLPLAPPPQYNDVAVAPVPADKCKL